MDEIKSLILERALAQYKASGSTKNPDVKALGAWLKDRVWESRILASDSTVEQVYLANLKRVNYVNKSYEILPSFINDLRNTMQNHAGDSDWKVTATSSKRSTKVTKVVAKEVELDDSDSIEEEVSPLATYAATSETTSNRSVVNRYQPKAAFSNVVQTTSDLEYSEEEAEDSEESEDLEAIQTLFSTATDQLNNRNDTKNWTRRRSTSQRSTSQDSIFDRIRQNTAALSSRSSRTAQRNTSTTSRTSGLSTLSTTSSNRTTSTSGSITRSTSGSTTSSSKLPSGILGNRANTKKNLNRR